MTVDAFIDAGSPPTGFGADDADADAVDMGLELQGHVMQTLACARINADLSVVELGKALGRSETTMSRALRAQRALTVDLVAAMCVHLGIAPSALWRAAEARMFPRHAFAVEPPWSAARARELLVPAHLRRVPPRSRL